MSEFLDLSQQLTASAGDTVTQCALISGWGPLPIVVPAGVSAVELRLNNLSARVLPE